MKANNNSPIAEAARNSLANQPFNAGKGFDATRIDTLDPEVIQNIITMNDLNKLTAKQQVEYIKMLCASLGLNPLSKPLQLIEFDDPNKSTSVNKVKTLRVYATRDCTDQLRAINGVSVEKIEKDIIEKIFFVTVYVKDRHGRTDVSTGAVSLMGKNTQTNTVYDLSGQARANAMMKAETKAKRRATLSLCGLGFLDESEIEAIPGSPAVLPDTDDAGKLPEVVEPTPAASTEQPFEVVANAIMQAATLDDLTEIYENYISMFTGDEEDKLVGLLNERHGVITDEKSNTAADILVKVADLIQAAKTRQELEKIMTEYIDQFKPESIKQKFRDMLNARREQIRREGVSADSDKAATAGKGLFKRKAQ